jgi:hypothetical protein
MQTEKKRRACALPDEAAYVWQTCCVCSLSAGLSCIVQKVRYACAARAQENGPSCKVLCNGKPAWFKGKLPCFGKLTVACKPGIDAPKFAPKFFAASCKGFWTGIFGRRVRLSAPHVPQLHWPSEVDSGAARCCCWATECS